MIFFSEGLKNNIIQLNIFLLTPIMVQNFDLLSTHVFPAWKGSEFFWRDVHLWLNRTSEEIKTQKNKILNILLSDKKLSISESCISGEHHVRIFGDFFTQQLLDTLWVLNWALKLRDNIPNDITSVDALIYALENNTFEIDEQYKKELFEKLYFLREESTRDVYLIKSIPINNVE